MQLIQACSNNTISKAEQEELDTWRSASIENQQLYEHHKAEFDALYGNIQYIENASQEELRQIEQDWQAPEKVQRAIRIQLLLGAACLILAVVSLVGFLMLGKDGTDPAKYPAGLAAASRMSRVMILKHDGLVIPLSDLNEDGLGDQGDCSVWFENDSTICYTPMKPGLPFVKYNTISTPHGVRYTIKLPDGSTVVLNGSSSIRFPVSYLSGYRTVDMKGQAYFDIHSIKSGNTKVPFRISVNTAGGLNQTVTVTGTKFDINAYNDNVKIQTTLLEGSVTVAGNNQLVNMKAGTQLIIDTTNNLMQALCAAAEAIAWRNDSFVFVNTPVEDVVREINRWHGVSMDYKIENNERVTIRKPRSTDYSELLNSVLYLARTSK